MLNVNDSTASITPLIAAVLAGNRAMTGLMIGRGADVNFKGKLATHHCTLLLGKVFKLWRKSLSRIKQM